MAHIATYRPKKKIAVEKGEGLWLLSFSDLSMILISFFILMLSATTVDKKKAEQIQQAMEEQNVNRQQNNLRALQERIESEVKRSGLAASAKVTYDVDGLSVEFKDSLLFTPGSVQSNPAFAKVVSSVMNVIAGAPQKYKIILEGHTDDMPIAGGQYATNWELSASRAITLMRQFQQRGVQPNRMHITAFADTHPKVSVAGLKGKALETARTANRRVVIRIE